MVGATPAGAANSLLWFSDGRPTPAAHKAVDLLTSAATDGLDASDYGGELLRIAIENASSGAVPSNDGIIELDRALTDATPVSYTHLTLPTSDLV